MPSPTDAPAPLRPRPPVRPTVRERLARLGRRALRLALVIILVALVMDALVGDKGLVKTLRVRREYQDLEATLLELRHENTRMREEARRLREDPAAIEEAARRDLGLMRPGEVVFVLQDAHPPRDRQRHDHTPPAR
jgi:cell division protein FtsB